MTEIGTFPRASGDCQATWRYADVLKGPKNMEGPMRIRDFDIWRVASYIAQNIQKDFEQPYLTQFCIFVTIYDSFYQNYLKTLLVSAPGQVLAMTPRPRLETKD